jgi:hypothetical protein
MSAAVMVERVAGASPRLKARIAGAFYLVIFIAGTFAEFFVRDPIIDYGDAGATASNILAHETLYRLGGAALLVTVLCEPVIALIFYQLFKPVSRTLSFLAALFRIVYAPINGANQLLYFAPLVLLAGAHVNAFTAEQLHALALVTLRIYAQGLWITLIFFGVHCLLIGYLIFRSSFLPRILGVLMAIAGLCYLIHSFARLISPPLGAHLFPYVVVTGFIAEGLLTLWLLTIGVNVQRWNERAAWGAEPASV